MQLVIDPNVASIYAVFSHLSNLVEGEFALRASFCFLSSEGVAASNHNRKDDNSYCHQVVSCLFHFIFSYSVLDYSDEERPYDSSCADLRPLARTTVALCANLRYEVFKTT